MATTSTQELGTHLQNFTDFQRRAAGRNLPWLRRLRDEAFARFAEVGFPTTHDEEWRFTNVAPIARTTFVNWNADRLLLYPEPDVERLTPADAIARQDLCPVAAHGIELLEY